MEIVGRENELEIFKEAMNSGKSEMIATIGRRRVGKTFLIRKGFKDSIVFDFTGIYKATNDEHINRFNKKLSESFKFKKNTDAIASNWFSAFDLLEEGIKGLKKRKNKFVIFLDELPWIVGTSSTFLKALSSFWNDWAEKRADIILVVSGSATSWMIKKIFRSRGGLFGRTTRLIHLYPFNLYECEKFFKSKKISLDRESILELYLIIGGIPYYLDLVGNGLGTNQVVDKMFFHRNAMLKSEYTELFYTLFEDAVTHEQVVKSLAKHIYGLTRNELLKAIGKYTGGNFTKVLEELTTSGFITALGQRKNKKQDRKYKLTDPFILFYLKYVANKKTGDSWNRLATSSSWKSWSGLAFENLCYNHTNQILQGLKILGVNSTIYMWHNKGNDDMNGAQIDMVIDRGDKVVHICEMKYYNDQILVTKDMVSSVKNKISTFKYFDQIRKTTFVTFIAPLGIKQNSHSLSLVNQVVDIHDLFRKNVVLY